MKILNYGAGGRMGKVVTKCGKEGFSGCEKVIQVDKMAKGEEILESLDKCTEEIDCIVDFSSPSAVEELLNYAVEKNYPVVIATTGHNENELSIINEASKKIPIFKSGNMSIGIATLAKLAGETVKIFPNANVEIIEIHHNQKVDVPSGTALMLAESVEKEKENSWKLVGRHENGKRTDEEIGIHSLRLGNVFGEHEVIVNTGTETISLKHQAHTRDLFAEGAIIAGKFIKDKQPGMYNMYDIINNRII